MMRRGLDGGRRPVNLLTLLIPDNYGFFLKEILSQRLSSGVLNKGFEKKVGLGLGRT